MGNADLHLHTTASDGKLSPEELVQKAAEFNLSAISITDHDTTAGVPEAREEAKKYGIELLTGAEITCTFNKSDCHVLAYHFLLDDKGLNELLKHHQELRVERAARIIHQLSKTGIHIDLGETLAEANGSPVGRPHIAAVMENKGIVASPKEAFTRYLSDNKIGNNAVDYRSVDDAVKTIHEAGGAAVLAHPGRLYSLEEMKRLVQKGIDGIEVTHPSHRFGIQKKINNFADDYQLLKTGGSDFHGQLENQVSSFGKVTIDHKRVAEIKNYCRKYRKVLA